MSEPYQKLERDWAEFNNLDQAGMVAAATGTAALHLALESLQLPHGSEVITSDFNMIAVPRACVMAGLKPVFVDCDERLLMCQGGSKWTDEPELYRMYAKPVVAVHIYGRRCDMQSIHNSEPRNIAVIEDLAEAHGIQPHPQTDAATWSFYSNKIVAGEEGGAVWFRDPAHAKLARQLRSLGFTDAHDFYHIPRGHNYRMSNVHASLILKSLANIKYNVARRRRIESVYDSNCPVEYKMPPRDAPWVYDLRIRGMTSEQQTALVKKLQEAGIAARHAFKPMTKQSEFLGTTGPNAAAASREVIYLPLTVTEDEARQAMRIISSEAIGRRIAESIAESLVIL